MEPFTVLTGVAAPLYRADVNTDAIIPMRWLVTATRTGLGKGLFSEWRYRPDGSEEPAFVLNQAAYKRASILIAGPNFGCGSSREHAPWAFLDFGIRCIIAPGYASIFYENCLKNGILPVTLPAPEVEAMALWAQQAGAAARLTVDLTRQRIDSGIDSRIDSRIDGASGKTWTFELAATHRAALLAGRDEIDETLQHAQTIAAFQERDRAVRPWIYPKSIGG